MKKLYTLLLVLIAPTCILLLALLNGAPVGYSGSPLDEQECTSCHLPGPAEEYANWITTDIPSEGYTPGETYSITLTVHIVAPKYGFQITSETPEVKTGTWIITDADRTQLAGTTSVTHTSSGTMPQGTPNSWSCDWIAPSAGTGVVTLAAAFNVANDDGFNTGDMIYVSSFNILESTVGIGEQALESVGLIYPNPAQEYIKLDLPVHAEVQIFDINGRLLIDITSNRENEKIDVSGLNDGIYHMRITDSGQTLSRSFVKK